MVQDSSERRIVVAVTVNGAAPEQLCGPPPTGQTAVRSPKPARRRQRQPASSKFRLLRIPLRALLRPKFQPLPDLTLEAPLGRIVELPAAELLREVVLPGKRVERVVVVFVARAVI